MKDFLKNWAPGLFARSAFIGLSLSVLAVPLSALAPLSTNSSVLSVVLSTAGNVLIPAAHAEMVVRDIDDLKLRGRAYQGRVMDQYTLGEIYFGKIEKIKSDTSSRRISPYKDELFDEPQRNRIEAYFWYSLAAAQLEHKILLSDIAGMDPDFQFDFLTKEDIKTAKKAKARMQELQRSAFSSKITGPSLWTAQNMFVETYKVGGAPAHYMMGKLYRTGKFVDKSNYDAFVWMLAAEIEGFPNANLIASEYKGRILVNQEFLAVTTAERIVASSSLTNGGGRPGSVSGGRYRRGNSGPTSPGWGTDFQSVREHRDSGNTRIGVPEGVDSHHSSRSAYDMGNSHLAAGRIQEARAMYEIAIAKEPYSQASINASRQLQALTLTCSMRDDRVVRMSENGNRDRVHDIGWDRLQMALKALGYYTSYVDGKPGQETRRAVRAFQRGELNVDETGYLTTDQRVELICVAAQDVRDAESQIQLGIMYARGIGLNCNTAAAHAWFQKAADQGHPTALYNLGLMYLEGFYDRQAPGKYPYSEEEQRIAPRRVIDPDIARFFFEEAKDKGHPGAGAMISRIDSKGHKALSNTIGVVGCIDYEVEVDMLKLQEDIVALDAVVSATPSGKCVELKKAGNKHAVLSKRTKSIWDNTQRYDEHMGQSDRAVKRLSIAEVKAILDTTKDDIKEKMKTCSSP